MTPKAKVEANRRNAALSTGPRTAQGKSRSAQNSLRHGFASPLNGAALRSKVGERLALAIAGPDPDPHRLYQARIIAAAQTRLALIADARIGLLKRMDFGMPATHCGFEQRTSAIVLNCLRELRRLDRYERQTFSRRSRAILLLNL
jgi:hypothetical protein